jgi:hypothetical protein
MIIPLYPAILAAPVIIIYALKKNKNTKIFRF